VIGHIECTNDIMSTTIVKEAGRKVTIVTCKKEKILENRNKLKIG
jgi:hypothetical protein